ncbi:hypothetical protein CMV_025097 [Castanea mollissima]|uniref:Uncharacterized protein n=1 Tax=Castanea mollissima TaxID=60419 RepID=A0A8J4QD50_9ROSI|nr:hypothetical protein CMV_025097 [Castanea mollissima]
MESSKKRKSRVDGMFMSVVETLTKWKDYNAQLESSGVEAKRAHKLPAMGLNTSESTVMPSWVEDEFGVISYSEYSRLDHFLGCSENEFLDVQELMVLLDNDPLGFTNSKLSFGYDGDHLY